MKLFIAGGVNNKIKKKYLEGIAEIGNYLVDNNHEIICVGAPFGAIGEMYNVFLERKARVDVIVPIPYAKSSKGMLANSMTVVDTLYMLQQLALKNSQATIVLPGGNGTLAELYMITDSTESNFDSDVVIVYNVNGFYDKVIEMNNFMLEAGTLEKRQYKYFTFCNTPTEVFAALEKWQKSKKFQKYLK